VTAPALVTPRLRLEPIRPRDVDALHALLVDPHVRRYLCDDEIFDRDRVAGFVELSERLFEEHGAGLWAVREHGDARCLAGIAGYFWFHEGLELLYALEPAHWGMGYATEATAASIGFGFDRLAFDRIVASTDAGNVASVDVLERVGMRLDRREVVDGLDTIFYVVERSAFDRSRAPFDVVAEGA
jgi:ribosomal-protein-alanine N-acetyltransferase